MRLCESITCETTQVLYIQISNLHLWFHCLLPHSLETDHSDFVQNFKAKKMLASCQPVVKIQVLLPWRQCFPKWQTWQSRKGQLQTPSKLEHQRQNPQLHQNRIMSGSHAPRNPGPVSLQQVPWVGNKYWNGWLWSDFVTQGPRQEAAKNTCQCPSPSWKFVFICFYLGFESHTNTSLLQLKRVRRLRNLPQKSVRAGRFKFPWTLNPKESPKPMSSVVSHHIRDSGQDHWQTASHGWTTRRPHLRDVLGRLPMLWKPW